MESDPDSIRAIDDPIFWANFVHQLEDAKVHLSELVEEMCKKNEIDEIELGVRLGHIYGHLNRGWNGRRLADADVSEWYTEKNCRFPNDLTIT